MAVQNTLLQSENEGLLDILTFEKGREVKGKSLDLLQRYEYWEPSMMWTPWVIWRSQNPHEVCKEGERGRREGKG